MVNNKDLVNRISKLEKEVKSIQKLYEKTISYHDTDPAVSLSQARISAEAICKHICYKEGLDKIKGKPIDKLMLKDLIQLLVREKAVPACIDINLNTILKFGNFGSHDQGEYNSAITKEYVNPCLLALGTVFNWYMEKYYDEYVDEQLLNFSDDKSVSNETKFNKLNSKENKLIVVGNHAPPYRIFNGNQVSGFYFDVMNEIAKHIGFIVNYEKQSFKMALQMLKQGEADIMLAPNWTANRDTYIYYIKTAFPSERKVFYVHPESTPIFNYEDLYSRVIVLGRGRVYDDKIDNDENLKKLYVTNYISGIQLVVKNKNYVLITPEKEGDYLLDEHDIELISSSFYLEGKPSHIAFSRKSDKLNLSSKVEAVFKQLIESGTYQRILNCY